MNPLGIPQHSHSATWRPIPCFAVCIGEVGVSQAAPKTLDAGSGRDECVAFATTTHPDHLGIRNGQSEPPSLGGEDSRLSIINVIGENSSLLFGGLQIVLNSMWRALSSLLLLGLLLSLLVLALVRSPSAPPAVLRTSHPIRPTGLSLPMVAAELATREHRAPQSSVISRVEVPLPQSSSAITLVDIAFTRGCVRWCVAGCCSSQRMFCCQSLARDCAPVCAEREGQTPAMVAASAGSDPSARQSLPKPTPKPPPKPPPPPRPGAIAPQAAGYCAMVKLKGSCEQDDAGYWDVGERSGIHDLASCVAACSACARCAFVSFSAEHRVCSWHSHCDLSDLRWPQSGTSFTTMAVRPVRPPPVARTQRPMNHRRLRLGIITLIAGGSMRCGLVHWCDRARALSSGMPRRWNVTLGVLGDAFDPGDCPGAVSLPIVPSLRQSLHRCAEADGRTLHGQRIREVEHKWGRWQVNRTMYKWQVFSLNFDVVLFADIDFSFPRGRTGPWPGWIRSMYRNASRAEPGHEPLRFVGRPDSSSPINTGLFVALPSLELYLEGLAVLNNCSFSLSDGWLGAGRPSSLGLRPRYLSGPVGGELRLAQTAAYTSNSWDFVCGQYDQGFFWYMLYIRHRFGGYMEPTPRYHSIHWAGIPKPWRAILPTMPIDRLPELLPNLSSERGLDAIGIRGRTSPTILSLLRMVYSYTASTWLWTIDSSSQCARRHRVLRRAIERDARFDLLDLKMFYERGEQAEDVSPL